MTSISNVKSSTKLLEMFDLDIYDLIAPSTKFLSLFVDLAMFYFSRQFIS